MPNPSVSFRVDRQDLAAWQRVMAILRTLTPDEAERRLKGEGATGATTSTSSKTKVAPPPDPTGVRFVEAKVLAALGRLRLPVETKAKAFLKSHSLPDTVENRCAAMIEALTVMVDEKVDEWSTAFEETKGRKAEVANLTRQRDALRGEIARLQDERAKAEREVAATRADLAAARRNAHEAYERAFQEELAALRARGYKSQEIAAVVDIAHRYFPNGDLRGFVAAIEKVGGPARVVEHLQQVAVVLERYVGHLKDEAVRQERWLKLHGLKESIEAAVVYTRAGLEPDRAEHRTMAEVTAFVAERQGANPRPILTADEVRRILEGATHCTSPSS